jgi:hypothetical protein
VIGIKETAMSVLRGIAFGFGAAIGWKVAEALIGLLH